MKKVVFITCSPDMWEGFETLYLEHLNDPECIITVIPAIIFEKNEVGEGINPVCHTSGFPDYVSLTTMDCYLFSEEKPDIVYIQNAQDSSSHGMSLHPLLYTGELKKHTKKLVYVPYTVFDETPLTDEYAREEMRGFLVPYGVRNLDGIIVQSKAMKDALIELIAGKKPALIEEWDKKISYENYPRTLLLRILRKEDIVLPEEWPGFIYKETGNDSQATIQDDSSLRKVIMFCNSVSVTLCEDRNAFRKVRSVIDYFKNKDDYCLLWRPHPMLPEILRRLRPYLVSEYEELLEYYKNSGIGILDDSTTPTAAIVLSDMYFGDPCGACELYKVTGKSMLLENMRRKDDDLSALVTFLQGEP